MVYGAYRNRMNSVAVKENLLKQVTWFVLNVFSTRFFYQAANSFADIEIPNPLKLLKCQNIEILANFT
jgi:hypothetical protein